MHPAASLTCALLCQMGTCRSGDGAKWALPDLYCCLDAAGRKVPTANCGVGAADRRRVAEWATSGPCKTTLLLTA
jgi:hypothetical protein